MKIVYARQIAPETQESPLEWFGEGYNTFSVFGNRDYHESLTDIVERAKNTLLGEELFDELQAIKANDGTANYESIETAIMDYLPPENGGKYTPEQLEKLCSLVENYDCNLTTSHDLQILCDVLTIVSGETYDWTTIRGLSQSEWNYCVFPANENPNRFESEYFNLGTEWMISEAEEGEELNPDEVNDWSMYCYNWNDEEMRQEIADAAGCKPEQVVMYRWAGYIKTSRYEKVC